MVFNNVYEMITPPHVLKKTWLVEWFDGDDVKSYWTKYDRAGTGTHAMSDVVDEGFQYTTDTTTNDSGGIDFNSISHYSPTGSVFICAMRKENASQAQIVMAMAEGNAGDYGSGTRTSTWNCRALGPISVTHNAKSMPGACTR